MKITQREAGDVTILDLDGRLVRGVGDELFHATLDEILAAGRRRVLVNLSGVPFVDSSGIGELVAGKRATEELGGSLRLMRLENRVENTLRLSLLLPLFETYASETEALAAFGQG